MQKKFGKLAWDTYRQVAIDHDCNNENIMPEWPYLASDTIRAWDEFGASVVAGDEVVQAFHKFQVSLRSEKTMLTALPEEYRLFWVKAFEAVREARNETNSTKRSQDKLMYAVVREHIDINGYGHAIAQTKTQTHLSKHVIGVRKCHSRNAYRFMFYTREDVIMSCDVPMDKLDKALQENDHTRNFDHIPRIVVFWDALRALTEFRCRIYRPEWLIPRPESTGLANKYMLSAWLSYARESQDIKTACIYKKQINDTADTVSAVWEPGMEDLVSIWISKRKGVR